MSEKNTRDEAIERLLRTTSREPGMVEQPACLDVEMLASWAEGRLTGDARVHAESHASSCGRCQALLAAMARTASAAPEPTGASSSSWLRRLTPWMAPLGVATAAAVMWFAVLPRSDVAPPAVPAEPAIVERAQESSTASARPADAAKDVADRPAASAAEWDAGRRRDLEARAREEAARRAAPQRAIVQAPKADPAPADERQKREAVLDAVTPLETMPGTPAAAPRPPVPQPGPTAVAASSPAVGGQAKADMRLARQAAAIQESVAFAAVPISSPDKKTLWRIVGGRTLQHSADDGVTWTTQTAGADVPLVAGSAPSTNVCWLVGLQGAVLLTTDARTWQRIPFPERADLAGIAATSADAATVTTADGRTFVTTDRGKTWNRKFER